MPSSGLSGAIRRRAYTIPEYKTGHWLTLLLADRINSVEWALGKREGVGRRSLFVPIVAAAGALFFARRAAGSRRHERETYERPSYA